MHRVTHPVALVLISGLILSGCGSDDNQSSTESDPYGLGGTYHDYRSCMEQADDRVEEPQNQSMMNESAEPEMNEPEQNLAALLPEGGDEPLVSGLYFTRIELVEVGVVLDMQLEVDVAQVEGANAFASVKLRALKDDMASDVIAEDSDISVSEQNTFNINLNEAVMPGDFSPTGSDVVFSLELIGVSLDANHVWLHTRKLKTLDLPLAESTFYAVPWEARGEDVPTSCAATGGANECARIQPNECPNLVAGDNTFTSCGIERRVRIRLPSDHSTDNGPYKTIVLFHGLTSEQVDDIEEDTALNKLVDPYNFVLIEPYSRRLAIEWDQGKAGDNPDVAFFDDLLTCAQQQLGADSERLYAAGDSGGGMFTTFWSVNSLTRSLLLQSILAALYLTCLTAPQTRCRSFTDGVGNVMWQGQNFNTFANNIIPQFRENGHFVVACNHDSGHEWKPLFSPWYLDFLFAHTRSATESPFESSLYGLPDFCTRLIESMRFALIEKRQGRIRHDCP